MGLTYDGITYRSLEEQVRYDAEQVQLLKQADVTINENLQTINTDLQNVNTEINGKLTKPANPTAESAVTMLADGTVGTKLLSEIGGGGGGKLYRHYVGLVVNHWKNTGLNEDRTICFTVTDTSNATHNRAYWKNYFDNMAPVKYYYYIPPEPHIFYRPDGNVDFENSLDMLTTIITEGLYSTNTSAYCKDYGFIYEESLWEAEGYSIDNRADTSTNYVEFVVEL